MCSCWTSRSDGAGFQAAKAQAVESMKSQNYFCGISQEQEGKIGPQNPNAEGPRTVRRTWIVTHPRIRQRYSDLRQALLNKVDKTPCPMSQSTSQSPKVKDGVGIPSHKFHGGNCAPVP